MIEPYVRPNFLDYVVEFHITIRGTETLFSSPFQQKFRGPTTGENNEPFIKLT